MSDQNAAVVASAHELVVRYGAQTVLDGVTATIHEGERVGLVGRNGAGKSTFLRIAAGVLEPDSGTFALRRDQTAGFLPQAFELDETLNVHDNVLGGAQGLLDAIAEYETAPAGSARSAELLEQIEHADGWTLDQRATSLLTNLHAPDADRMVCNLSGGEKRRVALCRALIARPDFLILDEPTNHLDTGSIEWLEDFLSRYTGACLFVTHDRYFLDRVATRILEISRGKAFSYTGGYNDFLIAKASREAIDEQQERKRQKFLKREIEWIRKGPRARRTKSVDRIERFYEIAGQKEPEQELDVELVIPPAPKASNRVITAEEISFSRGNRVLFRDFSYDFPAGERVGIIGRNGLGKSTLIQVLLGELEPTDGKVEIGVRTQINYVDQNRLALDDDKTVWQEVGEGQEHVKFGEESITLRSYLRRFLFTEDRINSKIQILSGGERSRVLLAKILRRGGNVIVLDEPTNDLDLSTLRLLEEALVAFEGTVIVVSHDRYFLNRVCTQMLAFEGDGLIRYYAGNYDDYLARRVAPAAEPMPAPAEKEKAPPPVKAERAASPRKLKWKEERELEGMEAAILEAEEKVARLEAIFAAPDFYATHGDNWQQLEAELNTARAEVTKLYARWEELESIRLASGQ